MASAADYMVRIHGRGPPPTLKLYATGEGSSMMAAHEERQTLNSYNLQDESVNPRAKSAILEALQRELDDVPGYAHKASNGVEPAAPRSYCNSVA